MGRSGHTASGRTPFVISVAVLLAATAALALGTALEPVQVRDAAPAPSPTVEATPTSRPTPRPTATPSPTPSPTAVVAPAPPGTSNQYNSGDSGGGGGGGTAPVVVPPPVIILPPVVVPPVVVPPPVQPPYTDAEARAAVLRRYPAAVPVYGRCVETNYGTWGRTSDPPAAIFVATLGFDAGASADGLGGWVSYYSCD